MSILVKISTKNSQMTFLKTSKKHHMMSKNIFSQNWPQIDVRYLRFRFLSLPVTFSDIQNINIIRIRDFWKIWKIMDFRPFLGYFCIEFENVKMGFGKYPFLWFLMSKNVWMIILVTSLIPKTKIKVLSKRMNTISTVSK